MRGTEAQVHVSLRSGPVSSAGAAEWRVRLSDLIEALRRQDRRSWGAQRRVDLRSVWS
jgi:hypothetical protein